MLVVAIAYGVLGIVAVAAVALQHWRWRRSRHRGQSIAITKKRHAEMLDHESREER